MSARSSALHRTQTPSMRVDQEIARLFKRLKAVFDNPDHRVCEPRIAPDAPPMQLDARLNTSSLPVRHRLRQQATLLYLRRRQGTVRGIGPEVVVPFSISVELTLDAARARHEEGSPCHGFRSRNTLSTLALRCQVWTWHRTWAPPRSEMARRNRPRNWLPWSVTRNRGPPPPCWSVASSIETARSSVRGLRPNAFNAMIRRL